MKDLLYNFGVKQKKVLCFTVCIVFKSQNFLFFTILISVWSMILKILFFVVNTEQMNVFD